MDSTDGDRDDTLETLRAGEESLRDVADHIREVIWLFDWDSQQVVYVSPAYETVWGRKVEDLYARYDEWADSIHPDDLEHAQESFARVLESGGGEPREYRIVRPDGEVRWVLDRAFPIRDENGEIRRVTGLAEDITDRKLAEESLRDSEARYRAVVDDMPALVCRFLTDGTLTFVNKAYCEYFSSSPEDLVGQDFFQFLPEAERERVRDHFLSLDASKPMVTYEHQVIAPGGGIAWQQWTDRALFDDANAVVEYQSVGMDITSRKKLEEELVKVQKLESLGVLAGGIAHDFNNLLTAMLGNIGLALIYTGHESRSREPLEDAEKAISRAKDLTMQLLTFARGGVPVRKKRFIKNLIRDSANLALRGSNVKCEYSIAGDLWPVEVDEGQISQVVHNLVLNADQSMPQGGNMTVRGENLDMLADSGLPIEEGRYVRISVSDQGTGISEEHLAKVFDPYFTTKQKGSGLGLAVAYSIIAKHSGHLAVESELGKGSVFRFYLPAAEGMVAEDEGRQGAALRGTGRILLMDDEGIVRKVGGALLGDMGFNVEFAADGEDAVAKYKQSRSKGQGFDAVILDLTVPGGVGGKEAVKAIREVDPGAKVIVSSGYSNDPVMADHKRHGFDAVLAKPYTMEELGEVLRDVGVGGRAE